jgi:hypothetical protein
LAISRNQGEIRWRNRQMDGGGRARIQRDTGERFHLSYGARPRGDTIVHIRTDHRRTPPLTDVGHRDGDRHWFAAFHLGWDAKLGKLEVRISEA